MAGGTGEIMDPRRLIVITMLVTAGCTAPQAPPEEAAPDRSGVAAPDRPREVAPRQSEKPVPSPPEAATSTPAQARLKITGWWAFALLDRRTGRITGSANRASQTTTTESMVKSWLAADYLAALRNDLGDHTRDRIRNALRVSDDDAAEWLYRARGGDATIRRMIDTCRLTGTSPSPGNWALTRITAEDAARLGDCLADGTASGPRWRDWLLAEMRQVAPSNAFGIREAFPPRQAARVAVKNGWTARSATGLWHVSCLGIWDRWSLAVLVRYPVRLGLGYGAAACRDVTRQLFPGSGRAG
jgi:hypothetical protein